MVSFGDRLKMLRNEKNLQQSELGSILEVHKGSISNWENNKRFPDKEMIKKMCEFFNVTSDYMLGFSNDRNQLYDTSPNQNPCKKFDVFEELGKMLNKNSKCLNEKEKIKLLKIINAAWPTYDD